MFYHNSSTYKLRVNILWYINNTVCFLDLLFMFLFIYPHFLHFLYRAALYPYCGMGEFLYANIEARCHMSASLVVVTSA